MEGAGRSMGHTTQATWTQAGALSSTAGSPELEARVSDVKNPETPNDPS